MQVQFTTQNIPQYREIRDERGILISRALVQPEPTPAEACTIPCDGTGWTGNSRERCTTHYQS